MAKLIDTLKALQRMDGEILKLREEMNRWPVIIGEKQKDVEDIRRILTGKETELKEAKVEVENQELKLKSGEENIVKAKANLLKVKTNREYEAILHEIDGLKAENGVIEEKIIRGLDRIEGIEATMREVGAEIRAAEAEVSDLGKQSGDEIAEIQAEIDQMETDRKARAAEVDPDIHTQYERIRNGRAGLAVVPVLDNVCQGCYMTLTSQEINALLLADDTIISCKNCQRILYIEE
jgi:predicted  nucleic acid-binding Zn-ribbon protein